MPCAGSGSTGFCGHGQHDDRDAELGLVDLLDELRALDPALEQGVDHHDVRSHLADRAIARAPSVRTSSSLTLAWAFEQAADVLSDLRARPRRSAGASGHCSNARHRPDDTTRAGPPGGGRRAGVNRVRVRAYGDQDRALAARVRSGRARSRRPSPRRPARHPRRTPRSSSAETSRSRSRRTQRAGGAPWPALLEDRGQGRSVAVGGVVLRPTPALVTIAPVSGSRRGHSRTDPAVEPGEVLGVGEPDVDDGQAARARGGRPASAGRRAGRRGSAARAAS